MLLATVWLNPCLTAFFCFETAETNFFVLLRTPPFSSEDEVEEDDDIMQSYISPELSRPKVYKSSSSSKGNLSRFSSRNDVNSPEEDEMEEMKVNLKPSKGKFILYNT